jgi:hypothetical protein
MRPESIRKKKTDRLPAAASRCNSAKYSIQSCDTRSQLLDVLQCRNIAAAVQYVLCWF